MNYFQMKSCRDNHNTHFVFSNFFFFESSAVYEIMWKNIVWRGRPQITIWCMRIACCIPRVTNTHSHTHRLCNTHCYFTATMVARTRLIVLRYMCTACLVPHSVLFCFFFVDLRTRIMLLDSIH